MSRFGATSIFACVCLLLTASAMRTLQSSLASEVDKNEQQRQVPHFSDDEVEKQQQQKQDAVNHALELAQNFTLLNVDRAQVASMLEQHTELADAVELHLAAHEGQAEEAAMRGLKSQIFQRVQQAMQGTTSNLDRAMADKGHSGRWKPRQKERPANGRIVSGKGYQRPHGRSPQLARG